MAQPPRFPNSPARPFQQPYNANFNMVSCVEGLLLPGPLEGMEVPQNILYTYALRQDQIS